MSDIMEIYATDVFNDKVMKQMLSSDVYKAIQDSQEGKHLHRDVADAVAEAMKSWAISKGATHFTHWFQPMTGVTAEKHESFVSYGGDGQVMLEFSGKALVKGEPDASSLPNGGLRATFEARGYTAWDPSSYAYVKGNTLYIPTVFCSYNGDVLDKKTPLLRSMQALNTQAMRILKLFGNTDVTRVSATVGAEQEYFLIDKQMYGKRQDLINCGRTLFGARSPKGQELGEHYFGSIKPRVAAFMQELDVALWRLGVPSKIKHNESAPSQHELVPLYATVNIACDHNQIIMETMKTIAGKHGFSCLFNEKPFENINGSGKHNNWSLSTSSGANLLEAGDTPYKNAQFLLFLTAIIQAVDNYQELLRFAVASLGNDNRLGAHEAPPSIVSIFLGQELTEIIEAVTTGSEYNGRKKVQFEVGADVLPHFSRDNTDRNRTAPLAFTGNKFEFRMLGASFSISDINVVINTIVAESLREYSDILEKSQDFKTELNKLIKAKLTAHKRIIFNGDGYSKEWLVEAKGRNLLNIATTPDALPYFVTDKSVELFTTHKVFSKAEMLSRYQILCQTYYNTIKIEALTLTNMISRSILPSATGYMGELLNVLQLKNSNGVNSLYEKDLVNMLTEQTAAIADCVKKINLALQQVSEMSPIKTAVYYRDNVATLLKEARTHIDILEGVVAKKYWQLPTYEEMLFSID